MSHYILFLTHCTNSTSFRDGRANHNTRQLNFCFLISYIYCVYQTHTVFTYWDMKYKHKYEQALSVHPNGIACLQTHSWKKYTKCWPPKLYVICRPCEALWGGELVQSASKINVTLAFWSNFFVGLFLARQHHPLNTYVTVLKHTTVKTRHRGEAATCCLMAPH